MLKPIHRVNCSPALAACHGLMRTFALWLCDPGTTQAQLTQAGMQPPILPSAIEADWLWTFLQRVDAGQKLLLCASTLAAMPAPEKAALRTWVLAVGSTAAQFQPAPAAWPLSSPLKNVADWKAFRTLMEAFYEKGLKTGLPYLPDGTPVAAGGVTYADFVREFRARHRLNPDPNARQVCVLCGGPLGDTPHVDHWIVKSAYPLLSVCADNLTLICSKCNEAPNKGDKPVHSGGSFGDWFHPYLRPGNGALQIGYDLHTASVHCSALAAADHVKVTNLDALLSLTTRWTLEFKAEYAKQQGVLRRREAMRLKAAKARHTQQDLQDYFRQWAGDLVPTEPDHEVHSLLGKVMAEPARIQAWLAELAAVQEV